MAGAGQAGCWAATCRRTSDSDIRWRRRAAHLGEQTLGPDQLLGSVLPQLVLGFSTPIG